MPGEQATALQPAMSRVILTSEYGRQAVPTPWRIQRHSIHDEQR